MTLTITNTHSLNAVSDVAVAAAALPVNLTGTNPQTTCSGGTVTYDSGTRNLSLSGGALSAGTSASCTVTLTVTPTSPGTYSYTTGTVSSSVATGTTATTPTSLLVRAQAPTIAAAFSTTSLTTGEFGLLTLTFTNPNTNTDLTGLSIGTFTFPANLNVAFGGDGFNSCGFIGMLTSTQSRTLSMSRGTLAAGANCSLVLIVSSSTPATYSVTTGAVSSTNSETGSTATTPTSLTFSAQAPTIAAAFSPTSISTAGTSTLTLTITNTNSSTAMSGLAVAAALPANLSGSSPGTSCNGSAAYDAGTRTLSLTGGSLTAGTSSSCTVTLRVSSTTAGSYSYTTGTVTTSSPSTTGTTATTPTALTVTELTAPSISASFSPTSITTSGTSTLTLTISNTNASTALSGVAVLAEALSSNLTGTNPQTTCTSGTVTYDSGTQDLSLSGASLAAGTSTSCTVTLTVSSSTAGSYGYTTGLVRSSSPSIFGSTATTPTSLTVTPQAPTITAAFSPTSITTDGTSTLTLTINNPNASTALSTLSVTAAALPTNLDGAGPPSTTCSGGSAFFSSRRLSLSSGNLAASGSCTVTMAVSSTTPGTYSYTTGAVSSSQATGTTATTATSLTVTQAAPVGNSFTASAVAHNSVLNSINVATGAGFTGNPSSYAVGSSTTAQGGTVSISSSGLADYSAPRDYSGTDSFTVTATKNAVTSSPITVTLPVSNPLLSISLTGTGARQGVALSGYSIDVTGGTAPYSCYFIGDNLPTGVTLNDTCTLTGTPTQSGNFSFRVAALDQTSYQEYRSLSMTVAPPSPPVGTSNTTSVSVSYGARAEGIDAQTVLAFTNSPTTYGLPSPASQEGGSVAINPDTGFVIYDAPPGYSGTDHFRVSATNSGGMSAEVQLNVTVGEPALSMSLTGSGAQKDIALSGYSITTMGGSLPYSCATTPASGSLPAGVSLTSGCALSGTPTVSGTFTFTVSVTDSSTGTGPFTQTSGSLSLTVNAAPTATQAVASKVLTQNTAATSFTPVSGSGGTAPLSYSVSPTLPTGLSMNPSTGQISGTPTAAQSATVHTVTVTDANSATATATFQLEVINGPTATQVIASTALTQNNPGASFTPVTGSGGTAPLSYSVSPALPSGLSMASATGLITGTPAVAGALIAYTVTVTDGASLTATANFNLRVHDAVGASALIPTTTLTKDSAASAFKPITGVEGVTPYSYSMTTVLPTGLSLNASTGEITGTPTLVSSASAYTMKVTDANLATAEQTFQVTVQPPTPVLTFAFNSVTTVFSTVVANTATSTVTGGGAGAITYASSDTGVATINSTTGAITYVGVGTATITATQAAVAGVNFSATVDSLLTINPGFQVISFSSSAPSSPAVGGTVYTPVASSTSGLAVAFTIDSLSSAVCSLSGSTVSFIGAGTCKINANQAGNANYQAASQVQQSFNVGTSGQTISFTSTIPATPVVNGTYTPTATATSALTVNFTIDAGSAAICAISSGIVTFNAEGDCVINANQPGGSNYQAAAQVQQTVTVGKSAQTISFTSTIPTTPVVGGTYTPTATATSALAVDFTIDASSLAVCSISSGIVTFDADGNCVLNANQAGNASFAAAPQVQQTITVGKSAQTITFTSTIPTTPVVGGTYTPTATATSALAVDFTIDASSLAICSIASGVVSIDAEGSCVINADQAGDASFAAAPQVRQTVAIGATLSAQVNSPTISVIVNQDSGPVKPVTPQGGTAPFIYAISPALPEGMSFNTATGEISGVPLKSLKKTIFTITITDAKGQTSSSSFTLEVLKLAVTSTTALTSSFNPSQPGQRVTFSATVKGDTPGGSVEFFADGKSLGSKTLDSSGVATLVVKTLAVGSYSITATYAGDSDNYTSTSKALTQKVETRGSLQLFAVTDGADATFRFTSDTAALKQTITTLDGEGEGKVVSLTAGDYEISLADLGAQGFVLADITCTDTDATIDLDKQTVALELEHEDETTCTFTASDRAGQTTEMIEEFLSARANMILANQPDSQRRVARLNGHSGSGIGEVGALALAEINTLATGAPIKVGGSLADVAAMNGDANDPRFDVWFDATFALFEGETTSDRFAIASVGADYLVTPDLLVGGFVQFDGLWQKAQAGAGEVEGMGWMAGPYATMRISDALYFDVLAAAGTSSNTISPLGTFSDDFSTTRWMASAALIGEFERGPWTFSPEARFSYFGEESEAYTDSQGVSIPSVSLELGQFSVGPTVSYSFQTESEMTINTHVKLEGILDLFGNDTAFGDARGRIEAGIDFLRLDGISLGLSGSYDGIGSEDEAFAGRVRLSIPIGKPPRQSGSAGGVPLNATEGGPALPVRSESATPPQP